MLAVVLAPTDAALGQAVVTEPRVPSRIRQGLNVESGLNDGICVPLLLHRARRRRGRRERRLGGRAGRPASCSRRSATASLGGVVAGVLAAAVMVVSPAAAS